MSKQPVNDIDNQLNELRNEWGVKYLFNFPNNFLKVHKYKLNFYHHRYC